MVVVEAVVVARMRVMMWVAHPVFILNVAVMVVMVRGTHRWWFISKTIDVVES